MNSYEITLKPKQFSNLRFPYLRLGQYLDMYVFAIGITILFLLRDISKIDISKYIFLAIIGVYILMVGIDKMICFICFLMPLYVGLPGNFITILVLGRFIVSSVSKPQFIKINWKQFVAAILLSLLIFTQNIVLDYTGVYHMIFSIEIIVVLFMLSYRGTLNKEQCIFMYIMGVAVVGIVMLLNSLNTYTLSQLLSSASRLGVVVFRGNITEMRLHIDPNYYGYFCITALSCGWVLLSGSLPTIKRITSIVALVIVLFISFIGLSRAFFIVLTLWAAAICLVQREKSRILSLIIIALLLITTITIVNREIIGTVVARFREADIIGANGRINLLVKWYEEWKASLLTVLFGVGLHYTNVHNMQAQYLFGTGIVGTILIAAFAVPFIHSERKKYQKIYIESYVPMTVIFVMAGTVPVAQSLTFMFPVIIGFYAYKLSNQMR